MVTEDKCFVTKYGSIHKTKEEAIKTEYEEDLREFIRYVIELTEDAGIKYSENGNAAGSVYRYPDIFIKAIKDFNLIKEA